MKKQLEGIYTTCGNSTKLLAMRARVNGKLSVAYVKDGNLVSYLPLEELCRQVVNGPCLEFMTEN